MGIFKRKNTIGRSSLSKEDIDRLIDLQNPYRTDYSYVRSRSYRKDGSEIYENPRMFRFPINYYKRKWALEEAWNHGIFTYLVYYMMDFCGQLAHNRSNFFRGFYRVFYLFFSGFLSQRRRHFYDLNTSFDEQSNLTTYSDPLSTSQESLCQKENCKSRWSTLFKFFYRFVRTLIYVFTLGCYPRDYTSFFNSDETVCNRIVSDNKSFGDYLVHDGISQLSVSGSRDASIEQGRRDVLEQLLSSVPEQSEKGHWIRVCGVFCEKILPLILVLLVALFVGRWLLISDGGSFEKEFSAVNITHSCANAISEGLKIVYFFGKSFLHTLLDIPSSLYDNVLIRLHSFCELFSQLFTRFIPFVFFNSTSGNGYMQKGEGAELGGAAEYNDFRGKDVDLYPLLTEKESWTSQLAELKRERELNQEQFEELKRSIELVHTSFSAPSKTSGERMVAEGKLDERLLLMKIEKTVREYLAAIKSSAVNEDMTSAVTLLRSEFEKLSRELQNEIEIRIEEIGKETLNVRDLIANEVADLGADMAVLRNKYELMEEEGGLKLAELVRNLNDQNSNKDFKNKLHLEVKNFVTEQVMKEVENRLSARFDEEEASLRLRLINELRAIVLDMLNKRENFDDNLSVNNNGKDTSGRSSFISVSEYNTIRLMISEALKKYDADKTGKVDYALESSGASILSTRCTESYKKKSRVESIFGLPLWYSSYSPRQVIQHRASFASGECWAFRGTGYLVIKLAYPVYVTEVSYEHLPLCLHPEKNIKSAPKVFHVWSLRDVDDLSSKFLIGEYEYDNKGEALQTFPAKHTPHDPTPIIELIFFSNWGADYTCLYRIRVHGRKQTNGTILSFPEVDQNVREETLKKTESIDFTNIKNRV